MSGSILKSGVLASDYGKRPQKATMRVRPRQNNSQRYQVETQQEAPHAVQISWLRLPRLQVEEDIISFEVGKIEGAPMWPSKICIGSSLDSNYAKPILLRRRSGYFARAFSTCSLVLNGLDSGVNSRPIYSKSNHCSIVLDISNL